MRNEQLHGSEIHQCMVVFFQVCRDYCQKVHRQCADYLRSRMSIFGINKPSNPIRVPQNCTVESVPAKGGDKPECDKLIPISERGFIIEGSKLCYTDLGILPYSFYSF